MKNNSPKKISSQWILILMCFAAIGWAHVVRFIANKFANPDNKIIVVTVIVLVFLIAIYLFANDIKNSVEIKDDDDQAN